MAKIDHYLSSLLPLCGILLLSGTPAHGGESTLTADDPQVDKTATVDLPGFTIDVKAKEVRMEAEVCLDSGILEYVACLGGTFEHEAIFVVRSKPEHLHLALLLIGLTPYAFDSDLWSPEEAEAEGRAKAQLNIEVEWEAEGKKQRVPLHKLILDREKNVDNKAEAGEEAEEEGPGEGEMRRKTGGVTAADAWIFTGSFFDRIDEKNVYVANRSGVVIAIWPQSSSVIQYGKQTLNPYQGDEFGLEINEELCPAEGTKVTLVFSAKRTKTPDN